MRIKEINWGIVGCGRVTELKSGPAFNKVTHSKLLAVMRRNGALSKDYAERHGVPFYCSDASELINNPQVNAVYVATPPDTHASYAIAAMRAGKPVYVEKPMARTFVECQEMIQVSEETGMPLFVAYYRRSLPAFLKVKSLIDEGAIGKPLTVNIRLNKSPRDNDLSRELQSWHVNQKIAGGGYFYDLASHQFDYLDFVFGPVTEVSGIAQNLGGYYSVEDTVSATFRFESGVVGSGNWCFVVAKGTEEDVIEISGTKGKIIFSSFLHGDVQLLTETGTQILSFTNPENIQHHLINQVVQELRSEGKCNSTMYSAARTNLILEKIVESYYHPRLSKEP